jgi:GTP cyclohydrolase I
VNNQALIRNDGLLKTSLIGRVYVDDGVLQSVFSEQVLERAKTASNAHSQLKTWLSENGLDYDQFPEIKITEHPAVTNQVERFDDIDFTCRHKNQFGILDGSIHIAYIPKGKRIDLASVERLMQFFCQKPQQENSLTQSIFQCLQIVLQTNNVMISSESAFFGIHSPSELNAIAVNRIVAKGGIFQSENDWFLPSET